METQRVNGNRIAERGALDRVPPNDLDAERAVLGSLLIDPSCADAVSGAVSAEDFWDTANRDLFRLVMQLRSEHHAVDVAILRDRARTEGIFETLGGMAYLGRLVNEVPNAAHALYYSRIVAEKARLRRLLELSLETAQDAYTARLPAAELISRAEDRLLTILDRREGRSARSIAEVVHETLDEIDRSMRGDGAHAIPTGFRDLDAMLSGGFRPGELVIVAARPSMGKSALTADFTTSIAQDRLAVFFSLEMTATNLCERMLSAVSGVDGARIRNRTLSQDDVSKLADAGGELSRLQLQIDDQRRQRVAEIAATVRLIERKLQQKVELVVVDYLQLLAAEDQRAPREQQVANVARRLKALAKEQRCPVVAVCSVNRKSEDGNDKRPKLSMLRESGSIEFEADIVLLLHREDYYRKEDHTNIAEVHVAKQRNGPCGVVELRWDADHTRFQSLAPQRAEDSQYYETGFDAWNNR